MNIEQYIIEIEAGRKDKYRTEKSIRKHLPDFAAYVDTIKAPLDYKGIDMSFSQKLYHILNRDDAFNLGLCECGKRTRFADGKYKRFCSTQCFHQSDIIKAHLSKINGSAESLQKMRNTCRLRYGVDYASQNIEVKSKLSKSQKSDNVRAKVKNTSIQRYGVEWPSQFKETIDKINKSKKVNRTFNTSKIEDKVCEWLDTMNIFYQRQYSSSLYKYRCDIYLYDYQLYIEIQASWTHGPKPFDSSDPACADILSVWKRKAKNSKYYENAIRTWTIRDVKKRTEAKSNNISYLEIFSNNLDVIKSHIIHSIGDTNILFNSYYHEDFPYPIYSEEELKHEWYCLEKSNSSKYRSKNGIRIVNMFHKSIWDAHAHKSKSPINAWKDKEVMLKVFHNRLIHSKNNIFINDLWTIDHNHMIVFDSVMRDGLTITKQGPKVSVFSPDLAAMLIKKYLRRYNVITDPFSGFSGRLLGTIACHKQYEGRDISSIHINESNNILEWLKHVTDILGSNVTQEDILDAPIRYAECILTCPPYGSKEIWDDSNQIYMSCDEWISIVMKKYIAHRYVFVVDNTEAYKHNIVDVISNKSHFSNSKEYILVIDT